MDQNEIVDEYDGVLRFDREKGVVIIRGLEPGKYMLEFKESLQSIFVDVVEGVHFKKNFILQEKLIFMLDDDYKAIGISSVDQIESNIIVNISGHIDEKSVVYALFFNYLTDDLYKSVEELSKLNKAFQIKAFDL